MCVSCSLPCVDQTQQEEILEVLASVALIVNKFSEEYFITPLKS